MSEKHYFIFSNDGSFDWYDTVWDTEQTEDGQTEEKCTAITLNSVTADSVLDSEYDDNGARRMPTEFFERMFLVAERRCFDEYSPYFSSIVSVVGNYPDMEINQDVMDMVIKNAKGENKRED